MLDDSNAIPFSRNGRTENDIIDYAIILPCILGIFYRDIATLATKRTKFIKTTVSDFLTP